MISQSHRLIVIKEEEIAMSSAQISGYRTGMVDMAAGRISREIFVNEEIYREELERLFARAWLFFGHESQIPKPGGSFFCLGCEVTPIRSPPPPRNLTV